MEINILSLLNESMSMVYGDRHLIKAEHELRTLT